MLRREFSKNYDGYSNENIPVITISAIILFLVFSDFAKLSLFSWHSPKGWVNSLAERWLLKNMG